MLIRGARQVGKTWIVRQLGQRFDQFVEINFELYPQVKKIFHRDLDPNRITRDLSLFIGKKIIPGKSLLFFDAIQRSIVDTYRQDFNKYTRKFQVKYIDTLFNFAPTVAGRKFKYNEVPGSYRKRELIPALNLLVKAGVVHKIIPIEVKSGSPGTLKSMRIFLNEHKNSPFGIRFSGLNYAADNQLYSYPLYAVACVIDSSKALAGLLRGFLEE